MSRVHVIIDELALKGLEPVERRALVDGMRAELSCVLSGPADRRDWGRSHRTPVIKLGQMTLEQGAAGGRALGVKLAGAIGRRLRP
jgi:hypothetical protein